MTAMVLHQSYVIQRYCLFTSTSYFVIMFSFNLIFTDNWLFVAWWLFVLFMFISRVIWNSKSIKYVAPNTLRGTVVRFFSLQWEVWDNSSQILLRFTNRIIL